MSVIRRRILCGALVVACAAIGVLALSGVASATEVKHPYLTTLTEANGAPMTLPWGLAFDSNGDLYAADAEAEVVDRFDSSNAFVEQIGSGDFTEEYVRGVAVNTSKNILYVAESGQEEILAYKPESGKYVKLAAKKNGVGTYIYVAVDNSSGPNKGDVYELGGTGTAAKPGIERFKTESDGKLGTGTKLTAPSEGWGLYGGNGEGGMAINATTGTRYIASPENKLIFVYSDEDVLEKKIEGKATPGGSFEPISVAVEESTGDVYAADAEHDVVDEFSSSGAYLGQITGTGSEAFVHPLGVAVQNVAGPTHDDVYVSDKPLFFNDPGKIDVFGPEGSGPTEFELKVESTGTGTVTSSPAGINCGSECAHKFPEGEDVVLSESAGAGFKFSGWTGCTKEASGKCEVTMSEAKTVKATFTAVPTFELKVEKTGSGTITSSPSGIDCGSECSHKFTEGENVVLSESAETGFKFVKWTGCTKEASGKCEVTMSEAKTVKAEFAAVPTFELKVEKSGSGTITSTPSGISCGSECSHSFTEGENVVLSESAETGFKFVKWTGCTKEASGKCEVTMSEAKTVKAEFEKLTTTTLTVVRYGDGTVTSSPSGIVCGATCTAEFSPGKVTLTESPAGGYEFVGWIGCKATSASTCEVDLNGPTEVGAAFMKRGEKGEKGTTGERGVEGPPGEAGPLGPIGPVGPTGERGSNGSNGANGATGPAGPAGPAGPQGPAGPTGKVQLVRCTTVKQGKKSVQKCTTQLVTGPVTFTAAKASAHATLSRAGHVYATGMALATGHGRLSLRLQPVRALRAGRYTLTLIAGGGKHETIRTEAFTLR